MTQSTSPSHLGSLKALFALSYPRSGFSQDNPYFVQQARKARWTLSEGEETRSAGLWIWGLFNEPLYPYLLLQMQNLEIVREPAETSNAMHSRCRAGDISTQ